MIYGTTCQPFHLYGHNKAIKAYSIIFHTAVYDMATPFEDKNLYLIKHESGLKFNNSNQQLDAFKQ